MKKQFEKVLSNHGIIAFPTETVMGLGVLYNDEVAYHKLNQVKERPESVEIKKIAEAHVVAFVRTLSADAPKVDSVQPPLTAPSPPPALFC